VLFILLYKSTRPRPRPNRRRSASLGRALTRPPGLMAVAPTVSDRIPVQVLPPGRPIPHNPLPRPHLTRPPHHHQPSPSIPLINWSTAPAPIHSPLLLLLSLLPSDSPNPNASSRASQFPSPEAHGFLRRRVASRSHRRPPPLLSRSFLLLLLLLLLTS